MPFIQLPEVNLHYEHNGQGDNILLLVHGNFASWRWWQGLLTRLPPDYCAYAPEMRGFGDSDKPADGYHVEQLAADLHGFIQALGLPKVHLVGHSLGGAVSLQLALDHPETLHSLSLIAPAPAEGMAHLQQGFGLLPNFSNFTMLKSLEMNRSLLKSALQSMMPNLDARSSQFATLLDDATRLPSHAVSGFMDSLSRWNQMSRLPELDKPVLIIAGGLDQIVDAHALQRMHEALPNSHYLTWQNVGHAIPVEQPEALLNSLLAFIPPNASPVQAADSNTTQAVKPQALWQRLRKQLRK